MILSKFNLKFNNKKKIRYLRSLYQNLFNFYKFVAA